MHMLLQFLFVEVAPLAYDVHDGLVEPPEVQFQPAVDEVIGRQRRDLIVHCVVLVYL